MPSELWGTQTSAGGRTSTRSGYNGPSTGYVPPPREERPDIKKAGQQATAFKTDPRVDDLAYLTALEEFRTRYGTAMEGGAPMRTVTGFNIIPGQVMDTTRMNAAQREMYLPQNATAAGMVPNSQASLPPNLAVTAGGQTQALADKGFEGGGLSPEQIAQMYPGMFRRMYGVSGEKKDEKKKE